MIDLSSTSGASTDRKSGRKEERGREHIYLSSALWNGLWIIQQPISNEIRKEEPVLFVERPVSIFTVLRYPQLWRRLFAWLLGARAIFPNLRVLAPLPLFHLGHRFPAVFKLEFAIQRWWILRWVSSRSGRSRVLWIDHPLLECAIGRMGETICVYHVGDEASEFRTSHRPTMLALEDRALCKASVVFAASDELARVRTPRNPRTFPIQNAIDALAYQSSVRAGELADIETIPGPRVVFVGVVDTWVDIGLLETTARELPGVNFIIVGPTPANVSPLRSLANVHLLGYRHRRLVPGILRLCSASLVPFVSSALTTHIVPAKVFEALAAGIVPVCTAFSRNLDTLEKRRLVLVGRNAPEYVGLVRRAIHEDTPERRAGLAEFGLRQTWSERWREMRDILADIEGQSVRGAIPG